MNARKDVAARESKRVRDAGAPARAIRPPVDIFEDDTGITLHADMPGVSRDRLDIRIDHDSLSIEGDIEFSVPENMDALYADLGANRYRRDFSLGRELDTDSIEATLKDGVLILRIPKREEHKPRKIEVRTA